MFGRHITLFTLFGFEVKADYSWVFLAVLVTWSLAQSAFPFYYDGLSQFTYWTMGAFGAVGLFASVIFHEMCHSLVARRYGLPIRGITLFIFGGVAEMESDPRTPRIEFLMAAAGPLGSLFLGLVFFLAANLAVVVGAAIAIGGVLSYLALINTILAIFNMVPGFPLDGGRVLRAIVWYVTGNLRRATQIAAAVGGAFGIALIALGIVTFISGSFVSGVWWALLGLFLRMAAGSSVVQMTARRMFEGEPVAKYMTPDPVSVSPETTISDFVDDYVYRYYHEMFPVIDDGRLVGCVTLREVKRVPPKDRSRVRIGDIARPVDDDNSIDADAKILDVLPRMQGRGSGRYLVLRHQRLVGIIVLKDVMKMLAMRLDLAR